MTQIVLIVLGVLLLIAALPFLFMGGMMSMMMGGAQCCSEHIMGRSTHPAGGLVFAQVIRFAVKPDSWDKLRSFDEKWQRQQAPIAPGFKGSYILREQGSDRAIAVVLFESQQLAKKNSDRPETNQWYRSLLELIEGQPEFIDTEVFRSYLT